MLQQTHAVGFFQPAQGAVLVAASGLRAVGRPDDDRQHLLGLSALVPGQDDPRAGRPPRRPHDLSEEVFGPAVGLCVGPVVHVVEQVRRHPYEAGRRATGDESHVRLLQETAEHIGAAIAHADRAEHDLLTGRHCPIHSEHPARNDLWQSQDSASFQR